RLACIAQQVLALGAFGGARDELEVYVLLLPPQPGPRERRHVRHWRTLVQRALQRRERATASFRDQLYRPVVAVPHPTGDREAQGLAHRARAEVHALHGATNDEPSARHQRFFREASIVSRSRT